MLPDIGYMKWGLDLARTNPNFANVFRQPQAPDYDYMAAYRAAPTMAPNGHLSDIGKTPIHPTFSDESAQADEYPGLAGHWSQMIPHGAYQYTNPARGLFWANEEEAYQPQNQIQPGMLPLYRRNIDPGFTVRPSLPAFLGPLDPGFAVQPDRPAFMGPLDPGFSPRPW